MNTEQQLQIRLTIAAKCLESEISDTAVMEAIFSWVRGPQSSIVPVNSFKVVEK